MDADREKPSPYGSAHDLPSVVEMRQMLTGMKLLTRVVARDQREKLVELEQEMTALFDLVDRFYAVLGGRHWIFTDHLPVSEVRTLLASAATVEDAEEGLIGIIADRLSGMHWQMGLNRHEAMRARRHSLERARQHYLDEQWDSCALVLITIMDGFINDVEPAERRGLHAREPEEMVAWDSLVGHHMGLTAVMPVFLRTFKRRHEEEVFELHRHGIVHGTVVNYDNKTVASKAWNMLAAVVDWSAAKEKAAIPAEPKPTVRSTLALLADHARSKRYRDGFEPWDTSPADERFAELEIVEAARGFLESWKAERWALVAESLPSTVLQYEKTSGGRAVRAKQIYEMSPLVDYEIAGVSFPQASVGVIHGSATIGEKSGLMNIRWLHEGADGGLAMPDDEGARWTLAVYPPHTFINDGEAQ